MIEEKLKEMQKSIDLIECYQAVSESNCLLSQAKKEKYKKLEVYDFVEKEIKEFCEAKVSFLLNKQNEQSSPQSEFTEEEIVILKKLCQKLKEKREEPLLPSTPSNPPPSMRRIPKKNSSPSNNILSEEEIRAEENLTFFIGRNTRTVGHQSLEINSLSVPGPYSLVKILDINPIDKKAKIEFLSSNEIGVINLNELAGFEYME